MRLLNVTLVALVILVFTGCKKNESRSDIAPPAVNDSIVKLFSITSLRNGNTRFYYDEQNHRYKSFSWHHSTNASNWDSTIINYNSSGVADSYLTIFPMPNGDYNCNATVLAFDANGKILKKYKKYSIALSQYTPTYTSDVNDRSTIDFYDSIGYDAYNRLAFTYRIYDNPSYSVPYKPSYRKFYYSSTTDTSFNKIEYYDRDMNNNFRLRETLSFISFDVNPNPTRNDFASYGLLQPFITTFCLHPTEHGTFSSYFLTSFASNCNKISFVDIVTPTNLTEQLSYTYNSEGLPLTVVSDSNPANIQSFSYKKYRKY